MKTYLLNAKGTVAVQASWRQFAFGWSFEWGTHTFIMFGPLVLVVQHA